MSKLSDTQQQILTAASQHQMGLAIAPAGLPTAARNAVVRSMLNTGLLEERPAPFEYRTAGWRQDDTGHWIVLQVTDAGLRAIGVEPDPNRPRLMTELEEEEELDRQQEALEAEEAAGEGGAVPQPDDSALEPPTAPLPAPARLTLREAATALLEAWDAGLERPALPSSMEALRVALGRGVRQAGTGRSSPAPRAPREGTKQQAVLTLLRQEEGATIAGIMEATGWAQHTVRGFLAGLKKKGHSVEVVERVRQVGPGAQGAKGSYSIYRIGAAEHV